MSYLNYCPLFSFSVAATGTARHLLLYCIITYCYIILTLYVCHLSVSLTPVCHLSLSPGGWVVGACYYYWARHVMTCCLLCRRRSLLKCWVLWVVSRFLYLHQFSINLFSFLFCPLSFSPLFLFSSFGLDSECYWTGLEFLLDCGEK